MTLVTTSFTHVAEAVTARMTDLLSAPVTVVDDRGRVVASSRSRMIGLPPASGDADGSDVRVPIRCGDHTGEVIVAAPAASDVVPPRMTQALVELIVAQTTVDRFPNQNEVKNAFIHDLLRGPLEDEAAVLRQGQILGMDLTRPRAIILINAADYILGAGASNASRQSTASAICQRAQLIISSIVGFFSLPNDTICAYIGDGEVAVLKASSTEDLVAWANGADGMEYCDTSWANLSAVKRAGAALLARLRRDTGATVDIGIGRYHPTIRGLARSYDDARAALSLGCRFHGQNQVHCLDSLGIAAFVGLPDERTKIDLAMHLLSPLDQEPELLETLDVFFDEDCCPSSSAKRLVIHRNTLSYRLAKITSLAGLDPRRFDDAVQIRLALVLRTLRPG